MKAAVTVIALLIGGAGWFYAFYSRAAQRLRDVEDRRLNARRVLLRRANGATMILLAVLFFAGFNTVDADRQPAAFVGVWLGIFVLLVSILCLGLSDLRLTARLRRGRPEKELRTKRE